MVDDVELRIVRDAIQKRQAGKRLTQREEGALRRYQRSEDDRRGREYCEAIPQKHFLDMCGRQAKQVREQFERYGAPPLARTNSLTQLLRWLFRFLAENKNKFAAEPSDDPLLSGANSPALEEYRREKTMITRLQRMELEGKLVDLETAHEVFTIASSRYRKLGEQLQKKYGPAAHAMVEKAIDDVEREASRLYIGVDECNKRSTVQ